MTEIAFHFNAPDRRSYLCRLLRKATARGSRVVVLAPESELPALDALLWTFSALDFIPHCRAEADAAVLAASPVVLAATLDERLPHADVLVHLGDVIPEGFERFERLIEVVTTDAPVRQAARDRWRHYAQRGYPLTSHDIAAPAAGVLAAGTTAD